MPTDAAKKAFLSGKTNQDKNYNCNQQVARSYVTYIHDGKPGKYIKHLTEGTESYQCIQNFSDTEDANYQG